MRWVFTITDKNNITYPIDEPVGWADMEIEIKRDRDMHGIFFDYSGNDFQFHGLAWKLIKAEYELNGVDGNLVLSVYEDCGGIPEELYKGRLLFAKAEFSCGPECFVKMPVETTSEVMTLRNRWDQKVDLQTLKGFDEVTELQPYLGLGMEMMLPSKGIFMQDAAQWTKEEVTNVNLSDVPLIENSGAPNYNYGWFNIVPQFDEVKFSEFGNFATDVALINNFICSGFYNWEKCPNLHKVRQPATSLDPTSRTVYFDWETNTPLISNRGNENNFNAVKRFDLSATYGVEFTTKDAAIVYLHKVLIIRRKDGTFEHLRNIPIVEATWGSAAPTPGTFWPNNTRHTVSENFNISDIELNDGDYLYIVLAGLALYIDVDATEGKEAFELKSLPGEVKLTALSKTEPTLSKTFLINESLSRAAEAITNGNIRAYSDYFGRKDGEPYTTLTDGCGSLACITNGLFIRRQENRIEDHPAPMAVSLKDLFAGLNPIHNIGFGIEADPFREGFYLLRAEHWKYFYQDDVIMICEGVNKIQRSVQESEHFSTINVGYAKWEAEQYNGLDEFLTKRQYRTTLNSVKNELNILSTFIASGYALEITRRMGNEDSKDWRYDNDTFIICLKRGGQERFMINFAAPSVVNVAVFGSNYSFADAFFAGDTFTILDGINTGTYTIISREKVPGNLKITVAESIVSGLDTPTIESTSALAVEQGNVINPQNMIDPPTLYNYRISPIRNLMRWMDTILASYRQISPEAKVIFMDGEGNYFAAGEMESLFCKLEAGTLTENQPLDVTAFAVEVDAIPILRPERVNFEYPMSVKDFKSILANPSGKIAFSNACEENAGWVDSIKYRPNEGLATFTLIPEIDEI